jgi:uncharacterized damage-inducible protein DinB
MHPLTETWHINNRINLYFLEAIAESSLVDIASSKGRNVGEQFAHLHNVRLMWLKPAQQALLAGLEKIEKDQITKAMLEAQLLKSGEAIAQLFEIGISEGRIKGFKPHPTAFLGYLIAHEAYHRGQIALALKQSGYPLDKKISFGLWEWGTR